MTVLEKAVLAPIPFTNGNPSIHIKYKTDTGTTKISQATVVNKALKHEDLLDVPIGIVCEMYSFAKEKGLVK